MDDIGSDASVLMHGYWQDPFGISQSVKIGPTISLGIDIIFAEFIETGLPSGFQFAGGLVIGSVTATVALSINIDPTKNFLSTAVSQLALSDVLSFAHDALHIPIPVSSVPNFLIFKNVTFSIAPNGGQIGTIVVPQGIAFAATMVLFSEELSVSVTLDQVVSIHGELAALTIGPLSVQGLNGGNCMVDGQFGSSVQHVLVDGAINLLGEQEGVNIEITMNPFQLSFNISSNFMGLIAYNILAKSSGNLSKPQDIDVELTASFQQSLMQMIASKVSDKLVDEAENTKSIQDAQNRVNDAEQKYNQDVAAAKADVAKAQAAWTAVSAKVQSTINSAKQSVAASLQALNTAQANYDAAFVKADAGLRKAQGDFNAATQAATAALQATQTKGAQDIAVAQAALTAVVNAQFKSANDAVQAAQANVDALNAEIADTQTQISSLTGSMGFVVAQNPTHPEINAVHEMLKKVSVAHALAGLVDHSGDRDFTVNQYGGISVPAVTRELFSFFGINVDPAGVVSSITSSVTSGWGTVSGGVSGAFGSAVSGANGFFNTFSNAFGSGIQNAISAAEATTAAAAKAAAEAAEHAAQEAIEQAEEAAEAAAEKAKQLAEEAAQAAKQLAQEIYAGAKESYQLAQLVAKLAALEAALAAAQAALTAAKAALAAAQDVTNNTVIAAAQAALDAAKAASAAAISAAEAEVNAVKTGAEAVALAGAKAAVDAIKTGGEATILATATAASTAAQVALDVAQAAVNGLSTSAQYVAFKAAQEALQGASTGADYIAFQAAEQSLEAAKKSQELGGKILKAIQGDDILDIQRIDLSGSLRKIEAGTSLFAADVYGRFLGKDFHLTLDFNPRNAGDLIAGLFKNFWQELVNSLA